ncbi:MAG: cytochrome c oxidase assembly protein [Gammaproteobacteria bacterium]
MIDSHPTARANRRTVRWLILAVGVMFGFSFAMVPLYVVYCKLTGTGAYATNAASFKDTRLAQAAERIVTVEFVASLNNFAPWEFRPAVAKMEVHPGEFYRTSFHAKNLDATARIGQAIPSIAPIQAAAYLQKLECFCFSQQSFAPGEVKDMPVVFRIDPALDPTITTVTLSYTFYRVDQPKS